MTPGNSVRQQAVVELVWNSLDAEAHDVAVNLLRNDGGVVGVTVEDSQNAYRRDRRRCRDRRRP
ncbi:ATP-binding protein [Arthrobacter sp. NPDC080031]|uniref:ATP-binding protein n=1 Tax=Arthrobacter sp. NPDC080031 TaxID=3155918 RepID=UPI003450D59A